VTRQVLVVKPTDSRLSASLSEAFQKLSPKIAAEMTDAASGAMERLTQSGYDAVVLWAERPDELEIVVRVRQFQPKIPILLISGDTSKEFSSLALEKGASAILPNSRTLPNLVGLVEQAVELRATARKTQQMATQGKELSREVRDLAKKTREMTKESRRRLERPFRVTPIPLLVSNDADQAFQMVKAFEKAEMYSPLPILRTAEEAIAYLSGAEPYKNRDRYPLPSLAILDFHGPGMSGLEVLGWIRQHDRLKHLPVIMLTAAINPEDIKGAYGLQANSYLIKPGNFDELVEMVKAINLYWSSLNVTPDQ